MLDHAPGHGQLPAHRLCSNAVPCMRATGISIATALQFDYLGETTEGDLRVTQVEESWRRAPPAGAAAAEASVSLVCARWRAAV
jgi:hypothetical protein